MSFVVVLPSVVTCWRVGNQEVSSAHSVSKSLLLALTSFCPVVPYLGTPTPLLPCGQVRICFSYAVRSANLKDLPSSHLSPFSQSFGFGILFNTFSIISFSLGIRGFIISFISVLVGVFQSFPFSPFFGKGICGKTSSKTFWTILLSSSSSFCSLYSTKSSSSSMLIMLSFISYIFLLFYRSALGEKVKIIVRMRNFALQDHNL